MNNKKLPDSIPTTSVKIIEIYNKIDNELLETQPGYQRKLVWKKQHKYAFIETILKNFPFPEVYIASSDIDIDQMIAKEEIVDGQQRLSTIVEYIKGSGDFKSQNKIPSFNQLTPSEKKEFLNYKVSVKDLKDIDRGIVTEIFQRINSTDYSLNGNEKNNAMYGDGEISIFCKLLVDPSFDIDKSMTDIRIEKSEREFINSFFTENEVFSENDIKRMFDFQYTMLIISTLIEGNYFGRSTKINQYLEEYNAAFEKSNTILKLLLKSIQTIKSIGLPKESYWFNKANLFTLIIELSKVDESQLNLELLMSALLELESKVDIYFDADTVKDLEDISENERRYFEVARQGSHEKSSRDHRGRVISELIEKCKTKEVFENNPIKSISDYFIENNIAFSRLIPTKTGLSKSIMDATLPVRDFFKNTNFHDYDSQSKGPEHKISKKAIIIDNTQDEVDVTLYKANKRGDTRIWFSGLKEYCNANDTLFLFWKNNSLYVINSNKFGIDKLPK
ncbi:DUF262 domain-containing protein [Flammeovirga sp. SJP92]|uniref:DUF262 domain-containing protein n=1 Tax=Flammeovirga sp. SJP92 TaxID=1775430 RepID=UPI0007873022|nr:DUF262 domain-containing protein [Flammeovirga sp. SJP92]KXX69666.1 hypothetical protein AVL50_15505 [Flammeovirga sp. SJP92]